MKASEARLSASVDADLLRAAVAGTRRGEAPTVSAWVNDALRLKVEHAARLSRQGAFIQEFEASHGEITDDEMRGAVRKARSRAVVVRAVQRAAGRRSRPRRAG